MIAKGSRLSFDGISVLMASLAEICSNARLRCINKLVKHLYKNLTTTARLITKPDVPHIRLVLLLILTNVRNNFGVISLESD